MNVKPMRKQMLVLIIEGVALLPWIGFGASAQEIVTLQSGTSLTVTTQTTPSTQDVEHWRKLLNDFSMRNAIRDEAAKTRILLDFMQADADAMPQEYRCGFLRGRLWRYQVDGDWEGMLAVRDKLMHDRKGLTDCLIDADILRIIESYFANTVFSPPKNTVLSTNSEEKSQQRRRYWEEHYRNYKEAERINQYIVDHFDPNYIQTAYALLNLAFMQVIQDEHDKALENMKKAALIDPERLYGLARYHMGMKRVLTAQEHLDEEKGNNVQKRIQLLPGRMVDSASQLKPKDRAIQELKSLGQIYSADKKIQEEVQKRLQQLSQQPN